MFALRMDRVMAAERLVALQRRFQAEFTQHKELGNEEGWHERAILSLDALALDVALDELRSRIRFQERFESASG